MADILNATVGPINPQDAALAALNPSIIKDGWRMGHLDQFAKVEMALKLRDLVKHVHYVPVTEIHFFCCPELIQGGGKEYLSGRIVGLEESQKDALAGNKGLMVYDQKALILKSTLLKQGWTDEMFADLMSNKLAIKVGKKFFPVNRDFLWTWSQRAGFSVSASGVDFADPQEVYYMAGFLAKRAEKKAMEEMARSRKASVPECVVISFGHSDGSEKVFAVFSRCYGPVDQWQMFSEIVGHIGRNFGTATIAGGQTDHFHTVVEVDLKALTGELLQAAPSVLAGLRFGYVFHTSDTGASSTRVIPVVRFHKGGDYYPVNQGSLRKHTVNNDVQKTLDDIVVAVRDSATGAVTYEGQMYHAYTAFLDRLAGLIALDVPTSEVEALIRAIADKANLDDARNSLGKRGADELVKGLISMISPSAHHSVYDIVMMFFEAEENGIPLPFPTDFDHAVSGRMAYLNMVHLPFEGWLKHGIPSV